MKTTSYFQYTRTRPDRAVIEDDWIEKAIFQPIHTETQSDGRKRHWVKIDEVNKYLRVILLEDAQTVHNAFFDRNFKETADAD